MKIWNVYFEFGNGIIVRRCVEAEKIVDAILAAIEHMEEAVHEPYEIIMVKLSTKKGKKEDAKN